MTLTFIDIFERNYLLIGIYSCITPDLGLETEITSNDDLRGEYNRDMECRLPGQQIVGVQVKKETHHGITNFRVLCA